MHINLLKFPFRTTFLLHLKTRTLQCYVFIMRPSGDQRKNANTVISQVSITADTCIRNTLLAIGLQEARRLEQKASFA